MATATDSLAMHTSRQHAGGRTEHHLLLVWLVFTGLLIFGLFLAWQEDLLMALYQADRSKISLAITLIYLLVTAHCALRVYRISCEANHVDTISRLIHAYPESALQTDGHEIKLAGYGPLPDCLMSDFVSDLIYQHKDPRAADETGASRDLLEVYAAKLKGPQEIGWFAADIMLKLGLLGTIIGFILMLAAVANVTDFDVATMQKILQLMSAGMSTALYTTLAGLVCSMLASAQYYMLDRRADEMLEAMQHVAEVRLKPALIQRNDA